MAFFCVKHYSKITFFLKVKCVRNNYTIVAKIMGGLSLKFHMSFFYRFLLKWSLILSSKPDNRILQRVTSNSVLYKTSMNRRKKHLNIQFLFSNNDFKFTCPIIKQMDKIIKFTMLKKKFLEKIITLSDQIKTISNTSVVHGVFMSKIYLVILIFVLFGHPYCSCPMSCS